MFMTQEQAKEIVTKKVPLPKGYRWYWRNELVEIIDSKKNYIIQSFLWTVVSHAATGIQIKYFEKIASNLKNVIGFKDYTKGE